MKKTEKERKGEVSRRRFLWLAAGGALGILGRDIVEAGSGYIIKGGKGIVESIEEKIKGKIYGPIGPEEAKTLFPHPTILKCDIGDIHPSVLGAHPDNLATGEAIYKALRLELKTGDTLDDKSGTLLAIGSPTSDVLARHIFGFGETSTWPTPNPWKLPIVYDHHDITQPLLFRWLAGREHRTRRRGIWITKESSSRIVAIDSDNRQLDDYLLVTVLPNYYDADSVRSGGRIWLIGGVHGAGTRGFMNVFMDKKIKENFLNKVSSTEYFQALFKVPEVIHDDSNRESYPKGIELLEFFNLDHDFCLKMVSKPKDIII